jgi:hypothetical protein
VGLIDVLGEVIHALLEAHKVLPEFAQVLLDDVHLLPGGGVAQDGFGRRQDGSSSCSARSSGARSGRTKVC